MNTTPDKSEDVDARPCPKCGKALIHVGTFWVCPTHGQISERRPFTALRIFLSYGHDSNEELVRRIKADLEQRGHDVWFDKTEIKAGDDWRRSITDGILQSQRVVSFLSKHSTRDPGVCRDEIAIAIGAKGGNIQTILVESEDEVQPPVTIGHIQWLDMHDWKERRALAEATWEEWYQAKLAEVIRVVESDESRRFAGEIETLHGHLKPIRPDARIYDLLRKGFIGRTWLFDAVEKWRLSPKRDSRLFWITGEPGVGKSAFAAQLTHTRSDAVVAAQFVEWDKPDHRDGRRVVRSIAFQLSTRLPDYRKLLLTLPEIRELDHKEPAELFDYLLANPLRSVIGGGRERQLIVIDALDEAGEAGGNPLVEMLARHVPRLPDWLGIVVTSRPESAVQTPLQGINPISLDTRTESNRADLRGYLSHHLTTQLHNRTNADRLIGKILDTSEGVFLYIERFCEEVHQDHLSLDRPDEFPQGLGGIFCHWFQRQFADLESFRRDVRPALRAILAAREPLPVGILTSLFNWQDEEFRDFTRALGSLFPVTRDARDATIKPYHKSLSDWLSEEGRAGKYFVSKTEGHRLLGQFCFDQWKDGPQFCVSEVFSQLKLAQDWGTVSRLLSNPRYHEDRFAKCGPAALHEDLTAYASGYSWHGHLGLGQCRPEVRAIFSIDVIISYQLLPDPVRWIPFIPGSTPDRTVPDGARTIREFIERGNDYTVLKRERDKLIPTLSQAKDAFDAAGQRALARLREPNYNRYAAHTEQYYEAYVVASLLALDAALALDPDLLVEKVQEAQRYEAMYGEDGEPAGAVQMAVDQDKERVDHTIAILQGAALRLAASLDSKRD